MSARERAISPWRSAAPAGVIARSMSRRSWRPGCAGRVMSSGCAIAISARTRSQNCWTRRVGHEARMIGMVLVTHGRLAVEFVAALEHIVGPQQAIAAICIGPDDDMEQRRREILESVARVENGDGVVLLTDMFGGTPSNLAISVLDRARVEVIAGVNLPMLIKLARIRGEERLADAVAQAQEAGRKYIHVASQLLADGRG